MQASVAQTIAPAFALPAASPFRFGRQAVPASDSEDLLETETLSMPLGGASGSRSAATAESLSCSGSTARLAYLGVVPALLPLLGSFHKRRQAKSSRRLNRMVRRARGVEPPPAADPVDADAPPARGEGWGRRRDGRLRLNKNQLKKASEGGPRSLSTLDREPIEDLGYALESGLVPPPSDNLKGSVDDIVDGIVSETEMLTAKGVLKETSSKKAQQNLMRFMRKAIPGDQKPQHFPHLRRAHDYDVEVDEDGNKRKTPRDTFFSRKSWEGVMGIHSDIVELTQALQLPRPARIQNQSFYDIAKGWHTLLADQAGSGKTLAYLLPLFQRYLSDPRGFDGRPKIVVLAPTSDLVEQVMNVARVISWRSGVRFRVECCTGGHSVHGQRSKIKNGVDMLVATPGRFGFLAAEDEKKVLDVSTCHAIVLDEVDVLVNDDATLGLESLREILPPRIQWIFVTATLGAEVKAQLAAFQKLPSVAPLPDNDAQRGTSTPRKALNWHTGAGLHRVSPQCEHILIDCSPAHLLRIPSKGRHSKVMHNKVLALAWHLNYGALRPEESNRVVIFCNTIDNCRYVENTLRKLDRKTTRLGTRQWKVLVLHGSRSKEDYVKCVNEFQSDRGTAMDFGKKKLLVCTDRLSRGMDFSRQPVQWVVLMDWPRDATEYIRRVGRTARGGQTGSVMALVAGVTENKMAKQVTAAAIKGLPLNSTLGVQQALGDPSERCLERFDPTAADWRSAEASKRTPRPDAEKESPAEKDVEDDLPEDVGDEAASEAARIEAETAEFLKAEKSWDPWRSNEPTPWEDSEFLDDALNNEEDFDEEYFDGPKYSTNDNLRVGVSLDD